MEGFRANLTSQFPVGGFSFPLEVLGKGMRLEITMRADELLKDVRNQMPKNSAGVLV